MKKLTHKRLTQLMDIEPSTGSITRRTTGKPAGATAKYLTVMIDGEMIRGHHIVWFYVHRKWPEQLDHINGDKLDNRIMNLREATKSQNHMNRSAQANCSSGYKGVSYHKSSGRWMARIGKDKKRIHLGYYPSPQDAANAYRVAALVEHGEFARLI